MQLHKLKGILSGDLSAAYVTSPVAERAFGSKGFELTIEVGQGFETAFVTDLGNVHLFIDQQFAGMPDAYLTNKIR